MQVGGVCHLVCDNYAHYACTQGQFASYCHTSARPFEVCPYPGVTPYTLCLRASNLHSIAVLQPATLESVLKVERINLTTVVVVRIPDCAAYISVAGQVWTAAVVSVDIMII